MADHTAGVGKESLLSMGSEFLLSDGARSVGGSARAENVGGVG